MKQYPEVVYAGFWLRFWAYLIDLAVTTTAIGAVVPIVFRGLSIPISNGSFSSYGVVKLILFLLYFIIMTKLTNGQTLGKIILGLRVVANGEESLTWFTIIFREGVGRFILQSLPGLLYLVTGFTEKKQGIADLFSDTYVVKEEVFSFLMKKI